MEVTHRGLGEKLHCVCKCQTHELPHATCEGNLTRASAYYTPEFARRAVLHMSRLLDSQEIHRLIQEDPHAQDNPRCSQGCDCKQVRRWNRELSCFDCMCDQQGRIYAAEQGVIAWKTCRTNVGSRDSTLKNEIKSSDRSPWYIAQQDTAVIICWFKRSKGSKPDQKSWPWHELSGAAPVKSERDLIPGPEPI